MDEKKFTKIVVKKFHIPSGASVAVIDYEESENKEIEFKDTVSCEMMDIYIPTSVDPGSKLKIADVGNGLVLDYMPLAYIKNRESIQENMVRKLRFNTDKRKFKFTVDLVASPVADIDIYIIFYLNQK